MDPVRDRVRRKFNASLDNETLAHALERAVYNWTVRSSRKADIPQYWQNPAFRYRYTTKALSVHFNVTHPKNPGVLAKVRAGDMTPVKLVDAKPYELYPELWEAAFEKAARYRLNFEENLMRDKDAPDGAFTCSKCKSKKTVFYEMQTRSADEPMTVFIQCLSCRRRWKQ